MKERMKKFDVFLVRYLPIAMIVYIGLTLIYAWNGIRMPFSVYIFSNSFIYSFVLFFVSLADKKYHCIWNRAMYIEMMVVPVINYADSRFTIFPTAEGLLMTLSITMILTLIATLVLAVLHFVRPRIKRRRHGRH